MYKFVDLSNNNNVYSFRLVKRAGIKGLWHKATEGSTFTDKKFKGRMKSAKKHNLLVGAYHYAYPSGHDAVDEAEHFLNVVGDICPTDLRPVLDFETNPYKLGSSSLASWANAWMKKVQKETGVKPLFYSYPYFIKGMHMSVVPNRADLWIASYGSNDGKVHKPWVPDPWKDYVAHQYTSNGKVRGISGRVDLNVASHLVPLLAIPEKYK